MIPTYARPYHDRDTPAVPDFMTQIITTIIQEFIAGNDAPCQSVQDYSQGNVTNDDAFDSYDELLIIFVAMKKQLQQIPLMMNLGEEDDVTEVQREII